MTSKIELGQLERVKLRRAWPDEPKHFTPWLALPENLALLSKTIDVQLEPGSSEESVGDFKADIVCTEASTGATVLIENQLGKTDHTHIGQILTYAAGLDAVTVIWIAKTFREEHRATLDWFNGKTDPSLKFFGLEIELWRIGDSPPAPKFNIVVKPNDWSDEIRDIINEREREHSRYWNEFANEFRQRNIDLTVRQARRWNFLDFSIGEGTRAVLSAVRLKSENTVRVRLVLKGETQSTYFTELSKQQEEIEGELSVTLDWDDSGAWSIIQTSMNADPADESDWKNQFLWIVNNLIKFNDVLRPRVRNITEAKGLARS